jgi:putative transcriptional regulator
MSFFQHHLLIAMPALDDAFFHRSIIYLCEHNAEGAMGIVLNHPLEVSVQDLLAQLDLVSSDDAQTSSQLSALEHAVLQGGPVQTDRGFVLHRRMQGFRSSMAFADDLMITTSRDILEAIARDEFQHSYRISLGYAGWSAGQLEQEIADNSWLLLPVNTDVINQIIFADNHADQWQQATAKLGIQPWQLSAQAGHA